MTRPRFEERGYRPFGERNRRVSCKSYVPIVNAYRDGKDQRPFSNVPRYLYRFVLRAAVMGGQLLLPSPILGIVVLFILAILLSEWWHFIVLLIFIFLMTNDIEYLFMCLSKFSFSRCILKHSLCLYLIDTLLDKLYVHPNFLINQFLTFSRAWTIISESGKSRLCYTFFFSF